MTKLMVPADEAPPTSDETAEEVAAAVPEMPSRLNPPLPRNDKLKVGSASTPPVTVTPPASEDNVADPATVRLPPKVCAALVRMPWTMRVSKALLKEARRFVEPTAPTREMLGLVVRPAVLAKLSALGVVAASESIAPVNVMFVVGRSVVSPASVILPASVTALVPELNSGPEKRLATEVVVVVVVLVTGWSPTSVVKLVVVDTWVVLAKLTPSPETTSALAMLELLRSSAAPERIVTLPLPRGVVRLP